MTSVHVFLICYISIAVVYRIIGEEGWNPIMWSNPVTVVCLSQDLDIQRHTSWSFLDSMI